MKKVFSSVFAVVLTFLLSLTGYAEGITVSRIEVVDYVLLLGIGVFLVGMILILLTIFVKPKAVLSDDEYDGEYEEEPVAVIAEEPTEDEEPEASEEDDITEDAETEEDNDAGEETSDDETPDESSEEAADEQDEAVNEPEHVEEAEEDEAAEKVEEVEEVKAVTVSFFGLNNADMRAFEIADKLTIGRRKGNDMIIEDGAVSGNHCEIEVEDDKVFINDLDSTNGTFVNDEPVVRCELKTGDSIILGKNKYRINIS